MRYNKFTLIVGKGDTEKEITIRQGHWNLKSAIKAAIKSNYTFPIEIEHCVGDPSGKGRGGHDGRWKVMTKDSNPILIAAAK